MTDMGWWNDQYYDETVGLPPAYWDPTPDYEFEDFDPSEEEDVDGTDDRQRCEMDLTRTQVCLTVLDRNGNCPNAKHHLRSTHVR